MATLLFLPGTLCDERVWEPTRAALSSEWHGIHVDYRHKTSISAMARHALSVAEGDLIPIGHSMGAIVALEMWRRSPQRVRAMALFGINPGAEVIARQLRRESQVQAAFTGALEDLARRQLAPFYFAQPESSGVLTDLVVDMAIKQGPGAFAAQSDALTSRRDYWPILGSIKTPTLLACGEHDLICPPKQHGQMCEMMQQVSFVQIPDAGHLAPLEQVGMVSTALQEWLHQLQYKTHHVNRITT